MCLVTDTTTTTPAEAKTENDETQEAPDEIEETPALTEAQRRQILDSAPMVVRLFLRDGTMLSRGDMWTGFGKDPAKVGHIIVHHDGANKPTHADIYASHSEDSEAFRRGKLHKVTVFSSFFDGFVTVMNVRDAEGEREAVTVARALAFAEQVRRATEGETDDDGPDVVEMAVMLVAHRNMPAKAAVKTAFDILDAVDEFDPDKAAP